MNVKELIELIRCLKAEDKQENKELIAFYEKTLQKVINQAVNKAFTV